MEFGPEGGESSWAIYDRLGTRDGDIGGVGSEFEVGCEDTSRENRLGALMVRPLSLSARIRSAIEPPGLVSGSVDGFSVDNLSNSANFFSKAASLAGRSWPSFYRLQLNSRWMKQRKRDAPSHNP
jgi:hypothetical protein